MSCYKHTFSTFQLVTPATDSDAEQEVMSKVSFHQQIPSCLSVEHAKIFELNTHGQSIQPVQAQLFVAHLLTSFLGTYFP